MKQYMYLMFYSINFTASNNFERQEIIKNTKSLKWNKKAFYCNLKKYMILYHRHAVCYSFMIRYDNTFLQYPTNDTTCQLCCVHVQH